MPAKQVLGFSRFLPACSPEAMLRAGRSSPRVNTVETLADQAAGMRPDGAALLEVWLCTHPTQPKLSVHCFQTGLIQPRFIGRT